MRLKGCPLRPSERRLAECGFLCCPWRRKRWPKLSASRADRTVVSLSKARGGFLQGALGVNWRVRMSRVQSTGSPHWMELCKAKSGRGCTGFAARHAMIMSRYLPSSPVPHVQGQFKSGRATGRGGVVSFPVRPCQAQPIGKRTEPALSPGVQVAVFPRPADVFRVAPGFGDTSKLSTRGCAANLSFRRFPDHGNETALPQRL